MGVSGIILNFEIAVYYGAAILGVFNQVFAIYIVLSQVCTLGVHFSAGKYIAQHLEDKQKTLSILISAVVIVALFALFVCGVLYALRGVLAQVFDSAAVGLGIVWIIPGLWCFAVNKTLLAGLNGLRHMRAYACLQSLRYIGVVLALVVFYFGRHNAHHLPVILSASEIVVFLVNVIYFVQYYWRTPCVALHQWFMRHYDFIRKGSLSGLFYEINIRVDIIMLGILTADHIVGIYSLAAIAIEGVIQLMVVVRANVNPKLTALYHDKKIDEMKQIIKSGVFTFYLSMLVLSAILIGGFYLIIQWIFPYSDFLQSWMIFVWLIIGLWFSAGYYPFNMILIQTGFVGHNTIYIFLIVMLNVVLNWILIPKFSLYGAAVATGVSSFIGIFILKGLVKKNLNIAI